MIIYEVVIWYDNRIEYSTY